MGSLTSFIDSEFSNQPEQWEKTLLAELKLPEIGSKAIKKLISGQSWPTLSLKSTHSVQLTSSSWKKASTTYVSVNLELIAEDLASGVKNFFFHHEALDNGVWEKIEKLFKNSAHPEELDVFILGGSTYKSDSFNVINQIISGEKYHHEGGHSVHELGLLSKNLIEVSSSLGDCIYLGVYVDSHFFHNIAKIRAAKLMGQKILEEAGKKSELKVVALTSYMGWTLFERYSNMLRNETAVASAYIGGADYIQSAGYNTLWELETSNPVEPEHLERSLRMARNTSHILALESLLGVVEDAAFGSFHLENLTQHLCEESWKLMQELLKGKDLTEDLKAVRTKRLDMIKTRKTVLSGINDYPDVKERLGLNLKEASFFRLARIFEELRLKMESLPHKPQVYVALFGDYGALNARLNFVKNYFELLGLEVHESGKTQLDLESFKKDLSSRIEEVIVLCAADDSYPSISALGELVKTEHKYIAGKFEMTSFTNLFAGQNIYEILENLVSLFERRSS